MESPGKSPVPVISLNVEKPKVTEIAEVKHYTKGCHGRAGSKYDQPFKFKP